MARFALTFVLTVLPVPLLGGDDLGILWTGQHPVPNAADVEPVSGVEFHIIKRWEPDVDGYRWLHGLALLFDGDRLYASFGHNKGKENTASEEARYCVSEDFGKTWSDVQTIDVGTDTDELAVSHGVFLSHNDQLWAFHGAFLGRMNRIHTRAYRLDRQNNGWIKRGIVVGDGFWPMNGPVKMDDGNWIMPGLIGGPYSGSKTFPAAVAISHGDDFVVWDLVPIPAPDGIAMWGESSLIVDGSRVLNIARYGGKAKALAAVSTDFGRTWTTSAESNLPMAGSKPAAGTLSNGQRYLVCTTTADGKHRRHPLTIAVSRPGENSFEKVFSVRPAVFPEGPGESGPSVGLAYPYAVERNGKLYIAYSNNGGRGANQNSAELAIVPIESLRAD